VTFVFAHGAGAPMDTPFQNTIAAGLGAAGVRVVRFEFPYMAARRTGGPRRGPDPMPVLEATFRRAVERVGARGRLAVGGKSMGGRVATRIAGDVGAERVVVFGFPFHPPGKATGARLEALSTLAVPCLVVQGTRDRLGNQEEVASYPLPPSVRVEWLPDGDHSFEPRVRSGVTLAANLERAVALAAAHLLG
jgi:hypothetical protein